MAGGHRQILQGNRARLDLGVELFGHRLGTTQRLLVIFDHGNALPPCGIGAGKRLDGRAAYLFERIAQLLRRFGGVQVSGQDVKSNRLVGFKAA